MAEGAETPHRSFRCPDGLWDAAKRATSDQGETITDVLIRALERYVREWEDGLR